MERFLSAPFARTLPLIKIANNSTFHDATVKIIDHCNTTDQERREDFWTFPLKGHAFIWF